MRLSNLLIEEHHESDAVNSFHCLFCRGYEDHTHLPLGVICLWQEVPKIVSALNLAYFAMDFSSSSHPPTILTNGKVSLSEVEKAAKRGEGGGAIKIAGLEVDSRSIMKIEYAPQEPEQITVHFFEGEPRVFGVLVYKDETRSAGNWAEHLGIETIISNPRSALKLTSPMGETSVKGVFAAGDCAMPLKQVTNAVAMGVVAGAEVANALSVERAMRSQ